MMLPVIFPLLGSLVASAFAQEYEPADFDVTEALESLGVNVTQLPELSSFQRSGNQACAAACSTLSSLYDETTVVAQEDVSYAQFTSSYWASQQTEPSPYCIFKAPTSEDVAVAVLLSRLTRCHFAVKSGGHAAFAGSSSIEGGITVSLERLNKVKLSCDKKKVVIQPGNRWADVYKKLDHHGVTVPGGRVSTVGTGGLTLGGGISFFSNLYGWACDNVASYEVVTAAGYIVNATPESNSDLYWALRGGGNNFGIVTSFTFNTLSLPEGAMWGGTRTYLENSFDEVTEAFAGVVEDSPKDPNAGLWVAWLENSGLKLAATELWYAKPNGNDAAIFDGFNAISPIADTTQDRILHEYTEVLNEANPWGLREVYYGLTVKADVRMAKLAREIFFEELPATRSVAGGNPVLIFQGIMEGQLENMAKNGGNALGLSAADGPLYIIHVACWWANEKDDDTVYSFISKVLTRIESEAKKLGVENDYIYMNYASEFEDVIANYGPENVARLNKVASLYDPTKVFQELQPGHFKLNRAPTPDSGYFSGLRG